MNPDISAGQTIASHYKLDRPLNTTGSHETWVATHLETGERLCLRMLPLSLSDEDYDALVGRLENVRGLLHENINLTSGWVNDDGFRFLIERYVGAAIPLDLDAANAWQVIEQLIATLKYAHSLGIVHGHLTPANLLVNNDNKLTITGFGLPISLSASSPLKSPQQTSEQRQTSTVVQNADVSDDIYALGHMMFRMLTGHTWETTNTNVAATALEKPLPENLIRLLDKMLSAQPYERVVELDELLAALRQHYQGNQAGIAPIAFTKQPAADTITETTIPAAASSVPAGRSHRALPLRTVLSAGAALIVIATIVFIALPTATTSTPDTSASERQPAVASNSPALSTPAATAPPEPGPTPVELARQQFVESESQNLAKDILRLQIELEDQGVNLWALDEYENASLQLDAADTAYREADFELALSQYQDVKASLTDIGARIGTVLAEQVATGDAALVSGDARAAIKAFTIATIIAPQDPAHARKLKRAENLDNVISLTNQAEMLERSGDLDDAADLVQQAMAIDSKWQPTIKVKQRLEQSILQRNFQLAMSAGFSGISNRDYDKARAGFLSAREILPNSIEPADGLAQVEQAENNDRIKALRAIAEQHVSNEAWSSAIDAYQSALAITPGLDFAIKGLGYAEERVALAQTLEKYLADPTLLQDDEDLSKASSALRDASRLEEKSAILMNHIDTLARLISSARTKVPVTLHSNEQTLVTVRKHAALGTFASEVVYLIPGRYTIVGERKGYRDVREELVILAGNPVAPVTIASTEKVR